MRTLCSGKQDDRVCSPASSFIMTSPRRTRNECRGTATGCLGRSLNRKLRVRRKLSIMQGEKVLAHFLVRCREPMIEAKKVHPRWRAERLRPK